MFLTLGDGLRYQSSASMGEKNIDLHQSKVWGQLETSLFFKENIVVVFFFF